MSCKRPSRYETLYKDVLSLITAGAFRPGERIPIKELASRLNVSPTPAREVLSHLAGRDIVEERRSEGFYLAAMDALEAAALYAFHGSCVLRALQLCTGASLALPPAATAWDLFAEIGRRSGDVAVSDVRDYLDDRLKVLRRLEDELIADRDGEAARLAALAARPSTAELKMAIRQFHTRRRVLATAIIAALRRPVRQDIGRI